MVFLFFALALTLFNLLKYFYPGINTMSLDQIYTLFFPILHHSTTFTSHFQMPSLSLFIIIPTESIYCYMHGCKVIDCSIGILSGYTFLKKTCSPSPRRHLLPTSTPPWLCLRLHVPSQSPTMLGFWLFKIMVSLIVGSYG